MLQKVMLEVESSTPLHNFGNGHIIVYDLTKRKYYATTREKFLSEQNEKIRIVEEEFAKMKEEFESLKESIIQFRDKLAVDLNTSQTNFSQKMEEKHNSFLKTYKETNAKIINMVENHIIK